MRVSRWAPAALWAAVILALGSVPNPERIGPRLFPGSDKVIHFLLYGVLGLLVGRALNTNILGRTSRGTLAAAVLAISSLGAIDEWHQHFISGRSPDAIDWISDTAGATAGLMLADLARRRREPST